MYVKILLWTALFAVVPFSAAHAAPASKKVGHGFHKVFKHHKHGKKDKK